MPIVLLAQTTFPTFNRDKYTTQGGIINPYTTNGRVDGAIGLSSFSSLLSVGEDLDEVQKKHILVCCG